MDLDTLLRETRGVPEPAPGTLDAGRAALDRAAGTANLRVTALRRSKQRRRRRAGVTVLVGAAATAALVLGPTLGPGDRTPPDSASAAEVLRQAADAAGAQGDDWSDAPYWHSVSEGGVEDGETYRREIWLSRSGPGVVVAEYPELGGEEQADGIPEYRFMWGDQWLTWEQLADVPSDPESVREQLLTGLNPDSSRSEADQLFTMVMDLLADSPLPGELRRSLWEIAAQQPGVTATGGQTDAVGRPGVLLTLDGDEHTGFDGWTYLIDPDEGRLLEARVPETTHPATDEHGDPTDGEPTTTPAWRATYLESGPADTAPEPPPDVCGNGYRGC